MSLIEHPEIGVSIDTSHMNIPPFNPTEWEQVLQAMQALENGAIANPTENRMVGHYWLRNPSLYPSMQAEILESWRALTLLKVKIQERNIETLLMVGIGGSALGPQFLYDALPSRGLKLCFIDNTDPQSIDRTLDSLDLSKTLVVVLSKSGGTKETRNGMLEVQRRYQRDQSLNFAEHAIAVTVPGSALDEKAKEEGWFGRLPLWDWVGGRTSITGMVGLLPLALMNCDWAKFLEGASKMDEWTRQSENNPALWLAHAWLESGKGKGDKAMVVLPYKDSLGLFGRYLQQLIMESIGKKHDRDGNEVHQGLTVYGNKGSTDQHAFVQQLRDGRNDFFATLIAVLKTHSHSFGKVIVEGETIDSGTYLLGFLLGTRKALTEADRDVMTLVIDEVDEFHLGALIALYERAVGFYAERLNLNAYDQPGVEAGKKAASGQLLLFEQLLKAEEIENADPSDMWLWKAHIARNNL